MVDISKCRGTGCPKKEGCYRFTARDSNWQLYLGEVPLTQTPEGDVECRYFKSNKLRKSGSVGP